MKLRLATKDDIQTVKTFYQDLQKDSTVGAVPVTEEQMEAYANLFLNQGAGYIGVIAEDEDGKPIGCCGFHAISNRVATIAMIYVIPEEREKGHSAKLIEAAEYWAKSNKLTHLQMSVLEGPNYKKLDKAYRKVGFEPVDHLYLKKVS